MNEVTKILEACSFQDITGQRITKVVKSLKTIDEKVSRLLEILEDKIPGLPVSEEQDNRSADAKLMNGPAAPDKAVSQADIDKLLADLF
jgi:chemotaxis protein CheZ